VTDEEWSRRDVDDSSSEGLRVSAVSADHLAGRDWNALTHLIKRSVGKSVTLDALPLSQSLLERRAQGQGAVLGRVVVVDVQVSFTVERERHASVLGQSREHLQSAGGLSEVHRFCAGKCIDTDRWRRQAMIGVTHMVQKSDARADLDDLLGHARRVVEVDRTCDLGLARHPLDGSCSRGAHGAVYV